MNEKLTFKDVIGYEEEKVEIKEIKNYIVDVEKYKQIGARAPKGILIVGAPGNGKTLMVRALANEINVPLYCLGQYTDEEENLDDIRKVFKEARKNSPCIIFIDEIDKINNNSNDFHFEIEESSAIRELLIQMDGFTPNNGIIVIATANSTSRLPSSLLRSGRFDKTINLRFPNKKERKELFKYYGKTKKLSDNIDFDKIAKITSGMSCADVDNVLNDAAILTVRNNKDEIEMNEIEVAIDRLVMKSANKKIISDEEKRVIAFHELGHAIATLKLSKKETINKISIVSRGQTLGHTRLGHDYLNNLVSKSNLLEDIKISLAGMAAEDVFIKNITSGSYSDLFRANEICQYMVSDYGMYGVDKYENISRMNKGISEVKIMKNEKVKERILKKCYHEVKKLLIKNKKLIYKLYDKLIECNVLFEEDINEIVKY